jgi:predicted ATPase
MSRHFERVVWSPNPHHPPALNEWPCTIPAVAQLIGNSGLDIPAGVTILTGENGSGKSTIIEALAAIYPRKGFENPYAMVTGVGSSEEDSPLRFHLRPKLAPLASRAGFFLRAEAMHAFLGQVDQSEKAFGYGPNKLQAQSHGESFLDVIRHRFEDVGVYFLDEPEAALSFQSSLALVALLDTMRRERSQVLISTHSPIIASLPGATLMELDDRGMHLVDSAEELSLMRHWKGFMESPQRYLRHLFDAG